MHRRRPHRRMTWLTIMLRMKPASRWRRAIAAARRAATDSRGCLAEGHSEARSFLKQLFTPSPVGNGLSPLRNRFERPRWHAGRGGVACSSPARTSPTRCSLGYARRHELSVRVALGAPALNSASTSHGEHRAGVNRRGRGVVFEVGESSHRVPVVDVGHARVLDPSLTGVSSHSRRDDGCDGGALRAPRFAQQRLPDRG